MSMQQMSTAPQRTPTRNAPAPTTPGAPAARPMPQAPARSSQGVLPGKI